MRKFKTFAEALTAAPATAPAAPIAANDNKPAKMRKKPEPRYRGTLPALRWLYDNHPDLAEPVAEAVQSLSATHWSADAVDSDQEIRPTVGELVRAATNEDTDSWHEPTVESDGDGNPCIRLGPLKFIRGELVEYGITKKGRKLQPRDRTIARGDDPSKERNPNGYVFGLRGAISSTLHAASYQRPFSGEPALAPMYAPQEGVEANRAELQAHGVDGSVAFEDLPFPATKCPTVIAKGAEFLGGVVQSGGTASNGALMWEAPEVKMGEARRIIEEIASGASLKEIGERKGYGGSNYAIEVGKSAIREAASVLIASNDNNRRKKNRAA